MWLNSVKQVFSVLMVVCITIMFGGCGSKKSPKQEITLYAAASLTESMQDIKKRYEEEHPSVEVILNLAGSKTLRSQIENGGDAALFLSANARHYDALVEGGYAMEGQDFLKNRMVLVTPKDSQVDIRELGNLTLSHNLVLAQEGVPAGDYAREVLRKYEEDYEGYYDGVMKNLVSTESNVKGALTKVVLGEADAAIVYKTDVTEAVKSKLKMIDIPDVYNVVGTYRMGLMVAHKDDGEAKEMQAFINGEEGKEIFQQYGFAIE